MIRNPFQKEQTKKKPDFRSVYDEGVDTERPKIQPPEIILDGGRYTVYVKNADSARTAGERLLGFFHSLEGRDRHKASLLGVDALIFPPKEPPEDCVMLKYGDKAILIYVGEDKSPESAYRRIGYTLQGLGVPAMLKTHGLSVIERA